MSTLPASSGGAPRHSLGEEDPPVGSGAWHAARAWRATGVDPGDVASLVNQARAELHIGAVETARTLLVAARTAAPSNRAVLRLAASAEYAASNHAAAARLFAAAADRAEGVLRGVLEARAAEAFERAGLPALARPRYRRAARLIPQVRGWLAVREARLWRDTATVALLLRRARGPEVILAADAMADALPAEAARQATDLRVRAGRHAAAAALALQSGEVSRGRRLLYRALRDTPVDPEGVERLLTTFPPSNADEVSAIASTLRGLGRSPEAVRVLRVAASSPNVPVLLAAADGLMNAGDRRSAAAALERALRRETRVGADGAYARARLHLRVRGEAAGARELMAFARAYANHEHVPTALYLVADYRERSGGAPAADSLYRAIVRQWPTHAAAAQARLRLARAAESIGRLERARDLYATVAAAGGPDATAARFMLGRTALAAGDSAAAAHAWTSLATEDAVGYYGMTARRAAGMPALVVAPPVWEPLGNTLRDFAGVFNLLTATGLGPEASQLVRSVTQQAGNDPGQLLTLGHFLLNAGWIESAVSIGWRASAVSGLTDPRVLRLVFPWPLREAVVAEARKFDLDPYLLAGLIRQESMFRPGVTSRAGARGLMQLMPGTAADVARRLGVTWHDGLLGVADANLHLGAAHLAALVRRFGGDEV
ncbi:MAG TPA: transglycosylase SLT domain-containing protein, partial [Gemmatimonadales bacterium]|nr:transglycosylase SLT domain-containing protein [Gemmatimonadales bacterium]